MPAYYNELDPYAARWLRNLIAAGLIAPGEVDERSIVDVRGSDLAGFEQCHFFAGIGVWSYALRLAGWPDDRPVWTGSCPCQPFSAAGRAGGFGDGRHLWPHWSRLIGECRPDAIFGEQVASADGLAWLDFVCADLEAAGYAVGAVDTCAAGFGAPHIRQRLFFVADATNSDRRRGERGAEEGTRPDGERRRGSAGSGATGVMGEPHSGRFGARRVGEAEGRDDAAERRESRNDADTSGPAHELGDASGRGLGMRGSAPGEAGRPAQSGEAHELGHPIEPGLEGHGGHGDDRHEPGRERAHEARSVAAAGATNGFWRDAEWIPCIDGKARPVEPGTFPLVTGAPARVGRLRAYGNCIVATQAAEFIGAFLHSALRENQPITCFSNEKTSL